MGKKNQKQQRRAKFKRKGEPQIFGFTDPYTAEAGAFFQSIKGESDRGLVLVAAAALDDILEVLLRRTIFPVPAGDAEREREIEGIFGLDGRDQSPLQSFGIRIRVAFAIGAIEPNSVRLLKAMQWIRNLFAHQIAVKFSDPAVADELFAEFLPPLLASEEQKIHFYLFRQRLHKAGLLNEYDRTSPLLFAIHHPEMYGLNGPIPLDADEARFMQTSLDQFRSAFAAVGIKNQFLQAFMTLYSALSYAAKTAHDSTTAKESVLGEKKKTLWEHRFGSLPAEVGLS